MSAGPSRARMNTETPGTQSALALETIAINVDMACDTAAPICQDTGMPTFEIKTPVGVNQIVMKDAIREAIVEATKLGKAPAEFRRLAHGEEQRQQPRARGRR